MPARITGRIRGQGSAAGRAGYIVNLYAERAGRVGRTAPLSADGSFSFEFHLRPESLGRRKKKKKVPLIHVRIFDEKGRLVFKTTPARFSGGTLDFQIQLGRPRSESEEAPDIYADNLKRLLRAYGHLEGRLDPSDRGAMDGLKELIRLIGRWEDDRRRLERAGAGEVVQVPRHPARATHRHVTTWDQVVLPP